MQIGIVTFHRAHNYGAVLQCYALYNQIKQMGHSVEILDYYPQYFREQYSLQCFFSKNIKTMTKLFFKYIFQYHLYRRRKKVFEAFINTMSISSEFPYCLSKKKYDVLVFGSDQIWNPLLTNGEDSIYSGKLFCGTSKLVAYAASSNPILCNPKHFDYFNDIVNRFDCISTRETFLSEYLNSIKPNCSTVVLDPVFILPASNWDEIVDYPQEENYLLIYTVPQISAIYHFAEEIAKENGLQIIEIRPNISKGGVRNCKKTLSPNQFLGYFKKASMVITTSFHGTAFSIIFKKPFYSVKSHTSGDERIRNLLSSIDMLSHFVDVEHYLPVEKDDIYNCNTKLNSLISDSLSFLNSSLS